MKIVIAPNSFKGSLDAFKVAQSIENGLKSSNLHVQCELFPIADGGDHTLEVFYNWKGGTLQNKTVSGPLGEDVLAEWLLIPQEKTAVIEMAKASGISLIDPNKLNPLIANSFGTGELIMEAVIQGAQKIILGLGGSATVDGGLGILQALGAELLDIDGNIKKNINPLLTLENLFVDKIDKRLKQVEFIILCDVDNPLLGKNGAAHIFGPQKGADPDAVELLESRMTKYHNLLKSLTGSDLSAMPGAGAAGGIAVPLKALFNTNIVNGVDFLLEQMDFEEHIKTADLLITAEGKVDRQTMHGKGPYGVAEKATAYHVPTIILAGKVDDQDELNRGFTSIFPITNGPMSLERAIKNTEKDLQATSKQIGNLLNRMRHKLSTG